MTCFLFRQFKAKRKTSLAPINLRLDRASFKEKKLSVFFILNQFTEQDWDPENNTLKHAIKSPSSYLSIS